MARGGRLLLLFCFIFNTDLTGGLQNAYRRLKSEFHSESTCTWHLLYSVLFPYFKFYWILIGDHLMKCSNLD